MNITQQLPSYPYLQWNDDPDIIAFFTAMNDVSQGYLDEINGYQLPIYSDQEAPLLDWAATSIYGVHRPNLSTGAAKPVGPLNTFELNSNRLNEFNEVNESKSYIASDTEYQKIIQWNTFKGDGYQFTVRWLKRRIQRYLSGNIFPDQTYQVSIRFTSDTAVQIVISASVRKATGGAFYNAHNFASDVVFDQLVTENTVYTPTTYAASLQAAIQSGVLLLPFQYTFSVDIP